MNSLGIRFLGVGIVCLSQLACTSSGGFGGFNGGQKSSSSKSGANTVLDSQSIKTGADSISRRFSEGDLKTAVESFKSANAAQGGALWKQATEQSLNDFFGQMLSTADNDEIEVLGISISGRRDFLLQLEPVFNSLNSQFSSMGEIYEKFNIYSIDDVSHESVKNGLIATSEFIRDGMPIQVEAANSDSDMSSITSSFNGLALQNNPAGTTTSTLPGWVCTGATAGAQAAMSGGCVLAAGAASLPTAGAGGVATGAACTAASAEAIDHMKGDCTKPETVYPAHCQHNPFSCHDSQGRLPGSPDYGTDKPNPALEATKHPG